MLETFWIRGMRKKEADMWWHHTTPHAVILAAPVVSAEGGDDWAVGIQRNEGHNLVVVTGADDEGDTARSSGLSGTSQAMTGCFDADGVLDSWHENTESGTIRHTPPVALRGCIQGIIQKLDKTIDN